MSKRIKPTSMAERTHLQVVMYSMSDEYTILDDICHLRLHFLKRFGYCVRAARLSKKARVEVEEKHTMNHVLLSNTTPLRPPIRHPLLLPHELIQHHRPVPIHQTHSRQRTLAPVWPDTYHLTIDGEVFLWHATLLGVSAIYLIRCC